MEGGEGEEMKIKKKSKLISSRLDDLSRKEACVVDECSFYTEGAGRVVARFLLLPELRSCHLSLFFLFFSLQAQTVSDLISYP